MHESSIVVDAGDQKAVRRAVVETSLPRRSSVILAIALPAVLALSGLLLLVNGMLGALMLGATAMLAVAALWLVMLIRRTADRIAERAVPLGARIELRVDVEGIAGRSPLLAFQAPWSSFEGVAHARGALVLRAAPGAPTLFIPGRAIDREMLALIESRIAPSGASR